MALLRVYSALTLMTKCLECVYLAGSDRTPQWLFSERRGYCDHPEREGGRWNVLQRIDESTRCARFQAAEEAKVNQRRKALIIFDQRKKQNVR